MFPRRFLPAAAFALAALVSPLTLAQAPKPDPAPANREGDYAPEVKRVSPQPSPRAEEAPLARLANGIVKQSSVEGITEYRLPNGLKVLLFPDPSKPTITVNITYLVGSRMENYGETGMAHLLEHLMFKGTKKHPHIDQEYNKRGVNYNGTTWLDRTNYFTIFQATDDNLAWALELEADRMVNSFIAKRDLDSEMTVVRNEYEQGENSPFSVLLKRMQSVAYDWHSYGRSTIGNRSDIENVSIAHLQAFYRMYYQPDNAVLLVAGRFDEAKTLALVAKYFGAIPKPKRALPPLWTVEPTQDGERQFQVRRKGDIQIIAIAYHVPSNLHIDSDALAFASFILGEAPTGRLHKAIVEKGLASQVFNYPLMGVDAGIQVFGAVVKKGDSLDKVKEELLALVEHFGDAPPTKEEMERTKVNYINQVEKTLANHEAIGVQLSEYISLGDWRLFFKARDDLDKVTPQKVAAAAQKYFRRDNRTMGIFLPEDNPLRTEVPPTPTVQEAMAGFVPKAATSTAEAFDVSQANIDKRTKRFKIGNVDVALLSKKNRGEIVNVSLVLRIGNEKALFGQRMNSRLAGAMLARGTTKFTRAQLSDEFDRLKISGRISGPGASIQTTRPYLEESLRLVAHVLKEPSFPQQEFDQLVNQTVTSLMANMTEPGPRAADEVAKHFNIYPKGDWRYTPTLEESLAEVKAAKLEDVKRFHAQFYGASPAQIAIVGDFDEAAVTKVLNEIFANWTPAVAYQRITVDYRDIPPIERTVATPDKENAIFIARENVDMRDDDPDYPALFVADYILGGGAGFDSRLANRIRQKEGLSYGVGSELSVGSLDRAGVWSAYAIAAPQNVAKVETAFKEELARAIREGFTDAEVANAKSGILQASAQSRAQDATLAGGWISNLYLGRTWAWSKQLEDRISALTTAQVSAALRKHIDPSKVTVVKAGDFSKK